VRKRWRACLSGRNGAICRMIQLRNSQSVKAQTVRNQVKVRAWT
jgi:hypothetical protein